VLLLGAHVLDVYERIDTENGGWSNNCLKQVPRRRSVGAFQQLPVVSPGCEILGTALRRAKMIKPTKGLRLVRCFV
jgi:hypothetical protein